MTLDLQENWNSIPKTRIVRATSDDRKQEYVLYICHLITGDERIYIWEDKSEYS